MLPLNRSERRANLRFLDAHWRQARPAKIRKFAAALGYSGSDVEVASDFIELFFARETQKETSS